MKRSNSTAIIVVAAMALVILLLTNGDHPLAWIE